RRGVLCRASEGGERLLVAVGLALELRELDEDRDALRGRVDRIDAALQQIGEQRRVAALARELLQRRQRGRVRGLVAERLPVVEDRRLVVGVADPRDLAEAEEQ